MLLSEFLTAGGKLYSDNYGIFDDGVLTARAKFIFGGREMRRDISADEIPNAGQMAIDVYRDYLRELFDYSAKFAPTASRVNTISRAKNGDNNGTTTNDLIDKSANGGTVTTVGTASDTPNLTTAINRSAYNAATAKPAETTVNSGTNESSSNSTVTNDTTSTTTKTGTVTDVQQYSENETVTERGTAGAAETREAFDKYIAPYDFLAREIVNCCCSLIWGNENETNDKRPTGI